MYSISLFLFLLLLKTLSCERVIVEVFDSQDNYLGSERVNEAKTFLVTPESLLNKTIDRIVVWSPFMDYEGGGQGADVMITSMIDLTSQENYTLAFELYIAGWDSVVSQPICEDETQECPDIIILGTTQVAARVYAGKAEPLSDYFNQWTLEKNTLLSDDFVRYYFYEFNMLGDWYAMPVISDTRVLFFNKTTFEELGLKKPPPHEEWENWSWKDIVHLAQTVHEKTGEPGYTFWGEWDEELKLFSIIGRDFGAGVFDSPNTCGFTSDKWKNAINEVIKPLWLQGVSNTDFYGAGEEAFNEWLNREIADPWDNPFDCCKFGSDPIYGLKVGVPSIDRESQINGTAELVEAYVPQFSFLGGSGAMMTSQGNKKDLAWKYMSFLLDTSNPYLNELAKIVVSPPPYDSLLSSDVWSLPEWELPGKQLKKSLPIQYPYHTFPQFGTIESKKPMRYFLMETIFKNYSIDYASDRVCQVINKTFLSECTEDDWSLVISNCNSDSKRDVTYQWDPSIQCNPGSTQLPNDETVSCEYIPWKNWVGILFGVLFSIFEVFDIILLILLYLKRTNSVVRKSSPLFSSFVVFGVIIFRASGYSLIGQPDHENCVIRVWFLSFGFTIIFSALYVKLKRIDLIFNNTDLKRINPSDQKLFKEFSGLLLTDIALLLIWSIVGGVGIKEDSYYEKGIGDITYDRCNIYGGGVLLPILLFDIVLFLGSCYVSWKIRGITKGFQEQRFIMVLSYIVLTSGVILIPMMLFIDDPYAQNVITLVIVLVWSSTISFVFVIPKLLDSKTGSSSNSGSVDISRANTALCHKCGSSITTVV